MGVPVRDVGAADDEVIPLTEIDDCFPHCL